MSLYLKALKREMDEGRYKVMEEICWAVLWRSPESERTRSLGFSAMLPSMGHSLLLSYLE